MPPARNQRPFKGRLEVVLRATQGNRNNIPYSVTKIRFSYLRENRSLIYKNGIIAHYRECLTYILLMT